MEKILHANGMEKKGWGRILITDKTNFKTKALVRDKKGNYIMIKGTTQQEGITLVNINEPNIGASKHVKQILMDIKGKID